MTKNLDTVINDLYAELEEQEQEIIKIKEKINLLREIKGEEPLFTDEDLGKSRRKIEPDQYYGKPLATAAREHLEYKGKACKVEDVITGLEEGGFDFKALGWKEDYRLRAFSMSLAKNSATFHRLPNRTYGLLKWYPEVEKEKNKKVRDQETPETEEGEEQKDNLENNTESDQ